MKRLTELKLMRASWIKCGIGGAIGVAVLLSAVWIEPVIASEWNEARTFDAIQHGGYVIYIRHADRSAGAKERLNADSPLGAFADCSDQRNLTTEGREDAGRIGMTFHRLKIPVGRVVALPLCRTRETARLAFGAAVLDPQLYDPHYVARLFAVMPMFGNTVLVDTEDQVRRIAGIQLRPGEAAVFQPEIRGGFRYVGTLDQSDLDP